MNCFHCGKKMFEIKQKLFGTTQFFNTKKYGEHSECPKILITKRGKIIIEYSLGYNEIIQVRSSRDYNYSMISDYNTSIYPEPLFLKIDKYLDYPNSPKELELIYRKIKKLSSFK